MTACGALKSVSATHIGKGSVVTVLVQRPRDAVPRTLSGKKLEVPVKKILMGGEPGRAASRDSLGNPEAFDWFVERAGELTSPQPR